MKKIIDRNNENFEEILDSVIQHFNDNGTKIDNVENFKKGVGKFILNEDKTLEIVAAGDSMGDEEFSIEIEALEEENKYLKNALKNLKNF